jgi:hypothetical protein
LVSALMQDASVVAAHRESIAELITQNVPGTETQESCSVGVFRNREFICTPRRRIKHGACAQDGGKPVHSRCADCAALDSALIFQCFWHVTFVH